MYMFTIKSVSDDGTYYLVKDWQKQKTFWKLGSEIKTNDMYKSKSAAKGALTKLLKVMDEYRNDKFSLIRTSPENKIVYEERLKIE